VRNVKGKESPVVRKAEGREVLRREMLKAKKVLSCEKPKAEKSFAEMPRARKVLRCEKPKAEEPFSEMPRARKIFRCEKPKAEKYFGAERRGHCNKCKRYDTFL